MKFGVREFIDTVTIGFENVEMLQEVVGVPSFCFIQEALNMVDSLMSFVLMSDRDIGNQTV